MSTHYKTESEKYRAMFQQMKEFYTYINDSDWYEYLIGHTYGDNATGMNAINLGAFMVSLESTRAELANYYLELCEDYPNYFGNLGYAFSEIMLIFTMHNININEVSLKGFALAVEYFRCSTALMTPLTFK